MRHERVSAFDFYLFLDLFKEKFTMEFVEVTTWKLMHI